MTTPAAAAAPRVSVVIVSHNTRDDLLRCLAALRAHARVTLETIVVDNASSDGSAAAAKRGFPEVRVVECTENLGFGRANNLASREAHGTYLLVLNSDAEVRAGCVEALCRLLDERPDVGIVGPRTLGADGAPQMSFGPALTPWSEWRQRRLVRGVRAREPWALARAAALCAVEQAPDWVSGSCLLARRQAFDAAGGFDESFFLYEEDVDLCVRVRAAGFRIVFTPAAEVVHHLGRSMATAAARARFEYQRSHLIYYRKHNGPFWTTMLRLLVFASGLPGWLGALGPGDARRIRRAQQRRILALAWSGPGSLGR
jgi:N-acetylglucosaminyl-diphospho-decaprenol L-rhamnosyltransferase